MLPNYEGTPFFIGVQKCLRQETIYVEALDTIFCLLHLSFQCNNDTSEILNIVSYIYTAHH
jgi:hypothetical protein